SAAVRIASCSLYSGSSKPGESVKMNCASSRVSSPMTGMRVDWGFGATIARCSPTRAFSSVDLPTLGRPASATVPQRVMGGSYGGGGVMEDPCETVRGERSIWTGPCGGAVMRLKTRTALMVVLSIAPHVAAQGPPVTRLGSRTAYGPGIVAAATRRVEFELT